MHSEPIESKRPCLSLRQILRDAISNDAVLRLPQPIHKHISDWYSAPVWVSNPNSKILRTPTSYQPKQFSKSSPRYNVDPRAFFHSSTHFIKIKKPLSGSKLIISKNKFISKHSGEDFGNFHHPHSVGFHHFDHFNHQPNHIQNINKNTHIHVHNRESDDESQSQEGFTSPNLYSVVTRKKRSALDVARLVIDPNNKLNLPKTAENVGAATRNLFEEEYSPVYHMRSSLSSANDAIYSLLNVRPSGLLIPCR